MSEHLLAHQEDAEGAGPSWKNQAKVGIDPAERLHHHEERDDHRGERDHHRRQDDPEEDIAPAIVELGKAVPRQGAGEQVECGDADADEEAIAEVVAQGVLLPGCGVVVPYEAYRGSTAPAW